MEPGRAFGSAGARHAASGLDLNLSQDWGSGYFDYFYNESDHAGEECVEVGTGWWGFGIVRAVLYCTVLVVGVAGNITLLGVLWGWGTGMGVGPRRRRSWRTSEILATNLAVSDLLFLGALPLWIHSEANAGAWAGGETTCKLAPYVTALTMHVGVLLLTVMSIDRYMAVVRPGVYRRVRKQCWATGSCVMSWLGSALLALPVLRVRELQWDEAPRCGESEEPAYPPELALTLHLLTFFLPLLLILSCYCSLARALRRHVRGGAVGLASGSPASLHRALRMVLLVAGAFLLCWLPFNSFKLLGLLERCLAPPTRCALRRLAGTGMYWAAPLGFAHSCLNPLAYASADRSLRRRIQQGAPWPCCCRKDGPMGGARGGASSLTTSWGEGGGDRESAGRDGRQR
ncbi:G-protein coupled receptor 15-like isoform X2 [Anguilla rostrata]